MRYFANQIEGYNPHTAEHWGFSDYMKWGVTQGFRGLMRIAYVYGIFVWRVVEIWYSMRGVDEERQLLHGARLRELSAHWKMSEEKLVALNSLRREPVTRRFWKVMAALFIDRVLLGAAALALATFCLVRFNSVPWKLGGALSTLLMFAVANQSLNKMRLVSPSLRLRAPLNLIQGLVCAPFIVFGHSHAPETVAIGGGATYFNTGTWASDDAAHAFTHLMVTGNGDGAPTAELRQWRDGVSAPYKISKG